MIQINKRLVKLKLEVSNVQYSDSQRFHEPVCINSNCNNYKDYMYTLNKYYDTIPGDKPLTLSRWVKEKDSDERSKCVVVTKKGYKQQCLQEFAECDLMSFLKEFPSFNIYINILAKLSI